MTIASEKQDRVVADAMMKVVNQAFQAGFSEDELYGLFGYTVEKAYFEAIMQSPVHA